MTRNLLGPDGQPSRSPGRAVVRRRRRRDGCAGFGGVL